MSKSLNIERATATSETSNSKNLSKNILDILNDDCIGEIFRRLKHLEDLVNAVRTCKRFQQCAMSLKYMFRSVVIEDTHHPHSMPDVISANNAPVVLRNVGHLIESVEWRLNGSQKRKDELFKQLEEFCGETLERLKITNYNVNFNNQTQFPSLNQLILYNAEPVSFRLASPLKYLEIQNFQHIEGVNSVHREPWFVRDFPHLESIRFNSTEITDDTLTQFLSFNQQIRALEVDSEYLSPHIFKSIGFYSRNIERLSIKSVEFNEFESGELHAEVFHLSALRKLSEFSITGRLSLKILLEMFAEKNVPIRSLEVDVTDSGNASSFETIKTLNNLKCICSSEIDENWLIKLVESQPALQSLHVINNMSSNITVEAIVKILKFGKSLTHFELSSCLADFNLENYNRILKLASNRVEVRIVVSKRRQVTVPRDILKMNRKWLRIMFG